jgi:hypothetical protein
MIFTHSNELFMYLYVAMNFCARHMTLTTSLIVQSSQHSVAYLPLSGNFQQGMKYKMVRESRELCGKCLTSISWRSQMLSLCVCHFTVVVPPTSHCSLDSS